MFLEDERVRIALLADQTLVKCAHRSAYLMNAHVGLKIAFGGEASLANLAPVRSFTCVSPVVHLES